MLDPKCIYRKSIFAKCTRLVCLLSFASLLYLCLNVYFARHMALSCHNVTSSLCAKGGVRALGWTFLFSIHLAKLANLTLPCKLVNLTPGKQTNIVVWEIVSINPDAYFSLSIYELVEFLGSAFTDENFAIPHPAISQVWWWEQLWCKDNRRSLRDPARNGVMLLGLMQC